MSKTVRPGDAITLGGNVLDSTTFLPKISGTITIKVQLERNGDSEDGYFWDTDSDGSWKAEGSVITWPTATHRSGSWWDYVVPTAATTAKKMACIKIVDLTDNEAAPASQTVIAGGMESTTVDGFGLENIIDVIESQRGTHTWGNGGQLLYVDPVNGDTIANGATGSCWQPFDTLTEALSVTVDSSHTVILLVPGASAGPTTLAEAVTVDKRYTFIRGPGRDFIIARTTNGNTITITADGCELSGAQIGTAGIGSGAGISVEGADFTHLTKLWINDTQGDGVDIKDSSNAVIEKCHFQDSGQSGSGHGLVLDPTSGAVATTFIRECHFSDVQGDAIRVTAGAVSDTMISHCEIHGSTGWGVNLLGGTDAFVHLNTWGNNTSGDFQDLGTDTVSGHNEPWAEIGDAMTLATGSITAAVIATGAIDADSIATGAIDAAAFAADAITAAVIATDAIDADALATDAAVEIANATDVVLTLAHDDGSWASGVPTGSRTITISVEDQNTDPVLGTSINVYDASNTTLVKRVNDIDNDGIIAVTLDDGTYSVRIARNGFTATNNPETLVVAADAAVTYSGTAFIATTSSAPLCTVWGYVFAVDGSVRDNLEFVFEGNIPVDVGLENIVTTHRVTIAPNTTTGYFEIALLRNTTVKYTNKLAGHDDTVITIPDAGSVALATLLTSN